MRHPLSLALKLTALIIFLSAPALDAADVTVTWTNNAPTATATIIERKQDIQPPISYAEIARVPYPTATYTDTTPTGTALYCYRARATNATATSTPSNEACTLAPPSKFTILYQP